MLRELIALPKRLRQLIEAAESTIIRIEGATDKWTASLDRTGVAWLVDAVGNAQELARRFEALLPVLDQVAGARNSIASNVRAWRPTKEDAGKGYDWVMHCLAEDIETGKI